jgi:hypothetical protein
MESPVNNINLPGVDEKIEEYVQRIKNGESKDSIFQGLSPSFTSALEKRLSETSGENTQQGISEIPSKYASEGMDSEILDLIWTIPEYIDENKTRELKNWKARCIAALKEKESKEEIKKEREKEGQEKIDEIRGQLGIAEPVVNINMEEESKDDFKTEEVRFLSIEDRKNLNGWPASYELAKIAKHQGVDLSELSREDYVDFAIKNSLAIDDDQLRLAPWQRMGASVNEIVLENRKRKAQINPESEKGFAKFCYQMKEKAGEENRFLSENIKVRQGTKDSDSWLFFGINNGTGEDRLETYKSYLSVKDLNTLTPERFMEFMKLLRDAGYNGDVKIFQDLSEQGVRLNDQIVMHGGSEDDAKLGLQVAEKFFGTDIDQKSFGKDEVIDGKSMSYSQVLAKKIREAVNPPKANK